MLKNEIATWETIISEIYLYPIGSRYLHWQITGHAGVFEHLHFFFGHLDFFRLHVHCFTLFVDDGADEDADEDVPCWLLPFLPRNPNVGKAHGDALASARASGSASASASGSASGSAKATT